VEHVPSSDVPWSSAPQEFFTGSALFGPMSQPPTDDGLLALAVNFAPGARTDWHHHPGGQVLHVTHGTGLVSNRDGETVRMSTGDTVTIPPGEVHWHGATESAPMTHLSLTSHGVTVWTGDKVSEEDYRRAHDA
jgi:4-carboxymuconolactone decarboxylase